MSKYPPIYQEGHQIMKAELAQLREVVDEVSGYAPGDLMSNLREAVTGVEEACEATQTITRGGRACDLAIAVLRQIKLAKAW